MWFITSELMPRASSGPHVLWMSSSKYLMNWWAIVWSLAKAGLNIFRTCRQSPEGTTSVSAYRGSFWLLLANKWKHKFHPIRWHSHLWKVSLSQNLHLQLSSWKSKGRVKLRLHTVVCYLKCHSIEWAFNISFCPALFILSSFLIFFCL